MIKTRTPCWLFLPLLLAPLTASGGQLQEKNLTTGSVPRPVVSLTSRLVNSPAIEEEIRSRARQYLSQSQLVVDYYRIARRVSFPLPLERMVLPGLEVPGIPDYPWEIWLSWELEERINSLGWAGQWFNDDPARTAANRELQALAKWPEFTPNRRLDLCLGHLSRTFWQAYTQWAWLDAPVRTALGQALDRLVTQSLPWAEARYGPATGLQKPGDPAETHMLVHNIPFIGLVGAALAANARQSPAAPLLNERIHSLVTLLLDLRRQGYSEGVAYDGYLLDFLASWLLSLPAGKREPFLREYDFRGFLDESYRLAAPGNIAQVAEIGDVEPIQMPFHISAQIKLQQLKPDRTRCWYLNRCLPSRLRADALGGLHQLLSDRGSSEESPSPGILDAQYAIVLRNGWDSGDLAVAVAASTSPAGHIHFDGGSITLGTAGRWLIADPGYQQYMPGEEREFTLGPMAHNAPVLNGLAQDSKNVRVLSREREQDGSLRLKLDLTRCYPSDLGVERMLRTVWLVENRTVVVADQIEGSKLKSVTYCWHGHPQSAWRVEDGWAVLYAEPSTLWFSSPSFSLLDSKIKRLPGSRGQLSLLVDGAPRPVNWWVFSLGTSHPPLETDPAGASIRLADRRFSVDQK